MQTLTETLWRGSYRGRLINESQLARLVGGSPQRRYNLVNRALKAGELIRLHRGVYTLAPEFGGNPGHPFTFAQVLVPGSYISFETALAFYGWIPEKVYETASVHSGRKSRSIANEYLGSFRFSPLATQSGYFLELVDRVQVGDRFALVAQPVRALLDLACYRKLEWQGMGWIEHGLRIDSEHLKGIRKTDLHKLESVYKQKRVKSFIDNLASSLEFSS